jgi:hypothetical protein
MMAVAKQKVETDNASETTGRTTKDKVVQRARRGRPTRKNGAEQMRQAADRRVGRISERLADLLEKSALEGDLASTRVLFGLAERKKPIPKPVKKWHGPTPAERLAVEPQWQGEEEDDDDE